LGGSQLGFRSSFTLARAQQFSVSASFRAYRSLRENDANVALGLMARLDGGFPVELILERRVALEADARSAWALGLAGGTYAENLPLGFELDAYFQTGIVGLVRRELYADASIGASQPVKLGRDWSLSVGGMAWISGQADLSRFDVGPRASVALPVRRGTGRISLAWRQRIFGDARPSSGPAVTLGIDF
jgi:hypothetical protein